MPEERFKQAVAVYILLIKDDKIFMHRRTNTDWEDGNYSIIGGHLEGGEEATNAAIREAFEETGVRIKPSELEFLNVSHMHPSVTKTERIHIAFLAKKWEGKPEIKEPQKADEAGWFELNDLPSNTSSVSRELIRAYLEKIPYSEIGWK